MIVVGVHYYFNDKNNYGSSCAIFVKFENKTSKICGTETLSLSTDIFGYQFYVQKPSSLRYATGLNITSVNALAYLRITSLRHFLVDTIFITVMIRCTTAVVWCSFWSTNGSLQTKEKLI